VTPHGLKNFGEIMTAISIGTFFPAELNTIEKMTYHNLLCLNTLYSNQQIAISEQEKQYRRVAIDIGRGYDGKLYAICRAVFELDETIVQSNPTNKKPWMAALDWGQVTYPDAFKQGSP
jgi:hypothetical protein